MSLVFAQDGAPLIGTWPRLHLEIAWNAGGTQDAPPYWYDVTGRVRGSWSAALSGRQYELDSMQAGTMQFTLDNSDGAFDPDNTASPFYGHVLPYRDARLTWTINPTRNLMWPWVADGTDGTGGTGGGSGYDFLACSTGDTYVTSQSGLPASVSGLTTASVWPIPAATASGAALGLVGALFDWEDDTPNALTVTPGQAYAAGVDLTLAPGGQTSIPMRLGLTWYTLTGEAISAVQSSTVSITTSSARLTVTGSAPAGAAFAIPAVTTTATVTTATSVRATAWQFEHAAAPSDFVLAGQTVALWTGFAQAWPLTYDQNGKYGLTSVTFVDGLGPLSQATLTPAMPVLIDQSVPEASFDLAAPTADGLGFPDLSGEGGTCTMTGGAITTGTSISSTTQQGTLWNTPGPVITLANDQSAALGSTSGASYLTPRAVDGSILLQNGGAWSRMICFRTTVTPGATGLYTLATLWAATADGFLSGTGDASGVYCYINSSGNVGVNYKRADGTNAATSNPFVSVCDGDWHCAIVSVSGDRLNLTITVDGKRWSFTPALALTDGVYTNDAVGTLLVGTTVNDQPFNGDLAWLTQWYYQLEPGVDDIMLTDGLAHGWSGDQAATRAARILNLAGYPDADMFTWFGTLASLGAVTTDQRSPLDILQETADTDGGQIAISANGTPVSFGHLWRWVQSQPRVTFGEDETGGEVPYAGDVQFQQDPARLFNNIQVTCDGSDDLNDSNATQTSNDLDSQAAYFPQSLTRTINPQLVSGGKNIADYLLSQFKDPHTRVPGLTIDLSTSPARQAAVLDLRFADLVHVRKRPAGAPMKELGCFIEQMTWSGDDTGKLQLALSLSPATQYEYWMISAAWAPLLSAAAAGATTVTVGPIQNNADIAAQYVLPAPYTMTLGYGTANAETVTVTAVQAVAAGYTSVQLTLAAATTHTHAAGDLICEPEPGNITIPPGGTYPSVYDGASEVGGDTPLIGF